ncbi:MAG: hypothetical protein FK734_19455 [Asgard group archaeon]|nr:hypothetical protein [Asgard group archaeon]
MKNTEGDIYELKWSSTGEELGTYNIDIRAQDEWGNADTVENIVSFTIINKPNIYVESLDTEYVYLDGEVDNLRPYDSENLNLLANNLLDNGQDALYSNPDIPNYYGTTLNSAPSGWSAYPDNIMFQCTTEIGSNTPSISELYPKFNTKRSIYSESPIEDIQINLRILPQGFGTNPTLTVYIHNFNSGGWEPLYSNVRTSGEWFNLMLDKDDLSDDNLEHYIDGNEQIELRIYNKANPVILYSTPNWALGISLAFIFPINVYYSGSSVAVDLCNVKVLYKGETSTSFVFKDANGLNLLDGENDYYLYFKGTTISGNAQLNVNGEKQFDISTLGTMVDEPKPLELYDVTDISISGIFDELSIDY